MKDGDWRRIDNIFNFIPILWRLKHMCKKNQYVSIESNHEKNTP